MADRRLTGAGGPRVPDDGVAPDDGVDLLVDVAPSPRLALPVPTVEEPAPELSDGKTEDAPENRDLIRRARDIHRLRLENRTRPMLAPTASPIDGTADAATPAPPSGHPPAAIGDTQSTQSPAPLAGEQTAEPQASHDALAASPESADLPPGREEALAARMAAFSPVPPVPASEMRPDLLGWGASRQEAEDRFDSVPAVDPTFSLPFREKRQVTRLRAGFDDPEVSVEEPGEPLAPTVREAEPVQDEIDRSDDRAASRWSSSRAERSRRPESRRRLARPTAADVQQELAPDEPLASMADEQAPEEAPTGSAEERADRVAAAGEPLSQPFSPSRFAFEFDDELDDPGDRIVAPFASAVGIERREEFADPEPDVAYGFSSADALADDLDDPFAAWSPFDDYLAEVPRCCRTCREFRPAEGGARGWCTSPWAFQHRRMVHADELPCQSAFGIWWLPSDDVWLDNLDVDHAEPTPLVDAMLARRAAAERPTPPRLRRGRR